MNAKDVLKTTLQTSVSVVKTYAGDLTDAELMKRPGPGCNHIAWQLGHLIASECSLINSIRPNSAPVLPPGFAEQHGKDTASSDDPTKFRKKQEYFDLMDQVNKATMSLIDAFPESDFAQPAPERFRQMFPTMGDFLVLIAVHPMMHAGQFVPVRRAVGKPVVI